MALRVLLADESSTIKKALQLALSDMGVEIKSVPSGIDVVPVALDFRPDIIFADVLLSKRNGYEVCADVKASPQLKNTPVVLMWSSFMEFDEKLSQRSACDARLEKPFDTESLRDIVNRLVKKTADHPLKGLLDFPTLPDFDESETVTRQMQKAPIPEIEIDEEIEDFRPTSLVNLSAAENEVSNAIHNDIHIETENFGEFEEVVLVKGDKEQELEEKIQGQLKTYLENSPVALNKIQKNNNDEKPKSLTRFEEQLMREEVRLIAEKICWQVIPEITEKIVREEIKKLLTNIEKSV